MISEFDASKIVNEKYFKMRNDFRPSNPIEIRNFMEEFYKHKRFEMKKVHSFDEIISNGNTIRLYKNYKNISKKCILFVHGGGFVFGNLNYCHQLLSDLCDFACVDIISIDYRKTPEFFYPTAHEDVLSSVLEIQEKYSNIYESYFLMGSSAGAMLCLHTGLTLSSTTNKLSGIILDSPAVDLNMELDSFKEFNEGYFLDSKSVKLFVNMYFKNKKHDFEESQMSNINNWLLISCGLDPLRDQSFELEKKLKFHNCNVNHHHFKDQLHSFHSLYYSYDIGMDKLPHLEIINEFINRQ